MPSGSAEKTVKSSPPRAQNARKPIGYALLVAALAALAYLLVMQAPAVNLAQRVPEDVAVFVEVPSVPHLLSAMAKLKVADADTTAKQTADGVTGAFAGAFHLTHDDADALSRSVVGVAFAARGHGKDLSSVWLLALSSTSGAEPLFSSSRVTADGALGNGGVAYRLAPLPAQPFQAREQTSLERWLRALSTKDDGKRLAWFAGARLLALGDDALVKDVAAVVDSGKGSLDGRGAWKRAEADAKLATPGADELSSATSRRSAASRPGPSRGSTRRSSSTESSTTAAP